MHQSDAPSIGMICQNNEKKNQKTADKTSDYLSYYQNKGENKDLSQERAVKSKEMTMQFYDLATDFYEYGWGESFHFYTMSKEESRQLSCAKHEYRLALNLGLKPGMKCLDVGCGVGGPARHIAEFSGSNITGINCNAYQVSRCKLLTQKAKLDHLINFKEGDFCNLPFEDGSFDRAYAIEATCHAGDVLNVFSEVHRALKPGGMFAFYEWIMTDQYDPNNERHNKIKYDIMEGDSLPDIRTGEEIKMALKKAGFKLVLADDLADPNAAIPWYASLQGGWTLADFKTTPLGRWCSHMMLRGMEMIGMAPKGALQMHATLCKGADALVEGGKTGIFSPMYLVVGQKEE